MRAFLVCMFTLFLSAFAVVQGRGQQATPAAKPGLTLTTRAFADGGIIPDKYTKNASTPVSPELRWTNVPVGTVSFTLMVNDPDTSLNRTTNEVLHWMIFNIPGTARELPEGVRNRAHLPDGTVQALNTGRTPGYMGMGAGAAGPYHHYTFELFALDTKLDLNPDATRADGLKAMDGHVLGKAALVGRFHR